MAQPPMHANMPFCVNCGQELQSTFCDNCGFGMDKFLSSCFADLQSAAVLRFDKVKPSDAHKLEEILRIIRFPDSVRRLEEVRQYVDLVKDKNLEPTEKSLAFEFFDYAVQAYLYGFDHATVYYAALAAELAMAAKVGVVVPIPKLINRAKKWLNQEQIEDATELRLLRDCYTHYQNLYLFTQMRNANIAEEIDSFQEISNIDKEEIIRNTRILGGMQWRRFPVSSQDSAYLPRYREFLQRREQAHLKWGDERRDIDTISATGSLIESGIGRGAKWFDRWAYDSLNAIEMSHRILLALDAFRKV